jgi:hypothetical protein
VLEQAQAVSRSRSTSVGHRACKNKDALKQTHKKYKHATVTVCLSIRGGHAVAGVIALRLVLSPFLVFSLPLPLSLSLSRSALSRFFPLPFVHAEQPCHKNQHRENPQAQTPTDNAQTQGQAEEAEHKERGERREGQGGGKGTACRRPPPGPLFPTVFSAVPNSRAAAGAVARITPAGVLEHSVCIRRNPSAEVCVPFIAFGRPPQATASLVQLRRHGGAILRAPSKHGTMTPDHWIKATPRVSYCAFAAAAELAALLSSLPESLPPPFAAAGLVWVRTVGYLKPLSREGDSTLVVVSVSLNASAYSMSSSTCCWLDQCSLHSVRTPPISHSLHFTSTFVLPPCPA